MSDHDDRPADAPGAETGPEQTDTIVIEDAPAEPPESVNADPESDGAEAGADAGVDVDAGADAEAGSDAEPAVEAEVSEPGTDPAEETGEPEDGARPSRRRKGDPEVLETEAEIAADYLEELLDIADLDGDIDTYIEGDRAHVSIVSENELLVGNDGAVLDALQELARLAVMTETGERSRLMLDVAGYREKRRGELIILAADAVAEVKSSQSRVPLAPMNPFERKIVHDAVAAAGLTSESEGEEPRRHVVVLPVG